MLRELFLLPGPTRGSKASSKDRSEIKACLRTLLLNLLTWGMNVRVYLNSRSARTSVDSNAVGV